MWVLKLGGSLNQWSGLIHWLDAAKGLPVVLVPGGGRFADQVRSAQCRWRFDDPIAHQMAVLAMEQTGLMYCGMNPGLKPLRELDRLSQNPERNHVWMPAQTVLAEPDIAQDWTVTSDSLALYLACRLRAEGVLMVKSASVPSGSYPLHALQSDGLIDDASHRHLPPCPVGLINREHFAELPELIQEKRAGKVCWISTRGDDHCSRSAANALAI